MYRAHAGGAASSSHSTPARLAARAGPGGAPVASPLLRRNPSKPDELMIADAGSLALDSAGSSPTEHFNIVSTIGVTRHGKSYLESLLASKADPRVPAPGNPCERGAVRGLFSISNSAEPVTNGIDIAQLNYADAAGKVHPLTLFDTEGTGNRSRAVDTQVFTPAVLLSSAVVYSTMAKGSAARGDVFEELSEIVAVARTIAFDATSEAGEGTSMLGDLHIVFRDYNLDNRDPLKHKDALFGKKYRDGDKAAELDDVRTYIEESFRSITVHLLPNPGDDLDAFDAGVADLWRAISEQFEERRRSRSPHKMAGFELVTSRAHVLLAEVVDAVNKKGVIYVPGIAARVLEREGRGVKDAYVKPVMTHDFMQPPPTDATLAASGASAVDSLLALKGISWAGLEPKLVERLGGHPPPEVIMAIKEAYEEDYHLKCETVDAQFRVEREKRSREVAEAQKAVVEGEITAVRKDLAESKIERAAADKRIAELSGDIKRLGAEATEASKRAEAAQAENKRLLEKAASEKAECKQGISPDLLALLLMSQRQVGSPQPSFGGMPQIAMGGMSPFDGSPFGGSSPIAPRRTFPGPARMDARPDMRFAANRVAANLPVGRGSRGGKRH